MRHSFCWTSSVTEPAYWDSPSGLDIHPWDIDRSGGGDVRRYLTLTPCEGLGFRFVMLNIGEFARIGQVSPRMLRHYDEIGLLKPNFVDPRTAYRSYEVGAVGSPPPPDCPSRPRLHAGPNPAGARRRTLRRATQGNAPASPGPDRTGRGRRASQITPCRRTSPST